MYLALKRTFPHLYTFLKKYEKHMPATIRLWDEKKYTLNLQIVSMLNYWKHYPRLKKESDIVFSFYNGGDFIDVGAHFGETNYTIRSIYPNKRIVSFEANPACEHILKQQNIEYII